MNSWPALACVLALSAAPALAAPRRLESTDYYRMRAVTSVQLSPDGTRAAYTVQTSDGPTPAHPALGDGAAGRRSRAGRRPDAKGSIPSGRRTARIAYAEP
jgi:hypothetical protein